MENENINQNYNGIAEDTRSDEEKAKDFKQEELFASAASPKWEERAPKQFPIFNQDGSSACVAFAVAKMLGIDEVYEGREFVHLSPRYIYTKRANKPGGGMFLPNALDLARKFGSPLESMVPSEELGETAQNDTSDIDALDDANARTFRSNGFVELPIDIDQIAAITSQGKGVLLGFRFDYDEWVDFPFLNPESKRTCGHGVAAVDNVLVDGKKYIVIDDSWGPRFAKFGQRYISEEFLKARCFYAGYTINLEYKPQEDNKPRYTFTKWLKRGDRNDDVKALQDILKYEGMFPNNVDSTGFYGAVTQRGVLKFQDKYIGSNNGGKQAGPKTIAKLNELYGA